MITRRDFIKTMSLLSGAVLAPVRWLGKWTGISPRNMIEEENPVGELYAGFLLLPEGVKVPEFVEYPTSGTPAVCGVGDAKDSSMTGFGKAFSTLEELTKEIPFPFYTLDPLPSNIRFAGGSMLLHSTGKIYDASTCFEILNPENDRWDIFAAIEIQPEYPRPYPLWSVENTEMDSFTSQFEKVDFLPAAGVAISTVRGYVFHWLEDDRLHTFVANSGTEISTARLLLESLTLVNGK